MTDRPSAGERSGGVQVLGRAIDILLAVARLQRAGASLAAITAAVGLNRTTCFRVVRYLAERGLLEYDEHARTYYIGSLAFELGLAARSGGGLVAEWQPRLEWVRAQTGMTVYLVARSDLDVVCLAVAEATSVVRAVPLVAGQRLPLGVGAGSLAILAACSDEEIDIILARNADKYRDYGNRRLGAAAIRERVLQARARGYALSADTVASGATGLGLTVPSASQLSTLGVSVSSPESYFATKDPDDIAAILRRSFTL